MMHELKLVSIRLKNEPSWFSREPLDTPKKVIDRIGKELSEYDREVFCILNLATDSTVINMNIVSVGTLNQALVSPREVFKSSILSNAASIIAIHNHVSGNIRPSREDELITKKLMVAGDHLDIPLVDHIIIGKDDYYSFHENGFFDDKSDKRHSLDAMIAQAKESVLEKDMRSMIHLSDKSGPKPNEKADPLHR